MRDRSGNLVLQISWKKFFLFRTKVSENASLRGQISQAEQNAYLINALGAKAPQAAYVVANPYTGTAYAGYGCGATSACGCGV